MQKHLPLLCALLVLTTASPKPYYRQHYQYQQQSESYKNDELQHKKEEAGRYAKIEDGTSEPIERSAFHQSEYHAPGADDDDTSKARLSLVGHGTSNSGNTQRYQQQSSFRREWSQQNSGTSGGAGVIGSGNADMYHSGRGYGHRGEHSQNSGSGTASQSLTSATDSSQGIYGTGNSNFANRGQMHYSGHGYGHRRQHSQSFTSDSNEGQISGTDTASQTSESHPRMSQTNRRYSGVQLQTHTGPTLYPGTIRVLPVVSTTIPKENPESSSVVPSSYRREWSQHSSFNTQGSNHHPGRGHGHGVGQRGYGHHHHHHNHNNLQTVDSARSESSQSQTITQQKEETQKTYGNIQSQDEYGVGQKLEGTQSQHVVHVKDFGDVDHGHHSHGRGHYGHGRGHGHGHQKHDQDFETSYDYTQQHIDFNGNNENTNTQTGQFPSTGSTFHSTSGTNTAAQNAGTVFYSQSSGTNTASQSKLIGTDSNRQDSSKLSGTGTVFYTGTGTNPNKLSSDNYDSSMIGTGSAPQSVVVPSAQSVGTGTVTHQTRRTYTISQSKLSGSTVPQTTDTTSQINRPGRIHLVSPTSPISNQGNIRIVPTSTTENIKPVYVHPEPEPEEPSSNDNGRLKNIFEEVNRIAQEDANIVKEQQSPDVTQKPVQVQQRPITDQQTSSSWSSTSQWSSGSGYRTQSTTNDQTLQKVDDLTQQNVDDYEDLTQETQDEYQPAQNSFGKLETKDITQQTQHGFDDTTQQVQKEYKFTPIDIRQSFDDTTQQVQKEYKFTPIDTHQKPANSEKPKIDKAQEERYTSQQAQRRYHIQSRVQKTEFAGQEVVTPEPVAGYWKIIRHQTKQNETQQYGDLTQQPQTGYGKPEFSGQQYEDDQTDLTQQHEDVFTGQQQDLTQHHDEFKNVEFNKQQVGHVYQREQQTQNGYNQDAVGNQYQKPQYSSERVVKISQQNPNLKQQSLTGFRKQEFDDQNHDDNEDLSQKTYGIETVPNTGSNVQGSGYSTSSSYSRSSSYSNQHQQQPQVVYSPVRIGSKSGQLQVYQTMQIPAGASEEMKRKLEQQLKQQLEQKMQELQSQQQSSQISMSPVHIGTQSGTGQLQVYQTMQIPAGASEELRHQLEEQLRQQLEQKMQELRTQQQSRSEFYQSGSQPLLVQRYSTGDGVSADCDDQTGGSYSSSYSSSSSTGSVGGNHYSMQLRPGSTVSSTGSSFQMTRQMQHPSSGYSY